MDIKTGVIGLILFLTGLAFSMAGCGEEESALSASSKKKEKDPAAPQTVEPDHDVDYFLSLCQEGMPESNKDEFRLAYSRATDTLYDCVTADRNNLGLCIIHFRLNLNQNLETCNFIGDPSTDEFTHNIQDSIVEVIHAREIFAQ